jgi:hypothetical protein
LYLGSIRQVTRKFTQINKAENQIKNKKQTSIWKDRMSTSKTHSSIKTVRRLAKVVKRNFFGTLELNPRFTTISIQEKQLHLGGNSKLCDILTCPIPFSAVPQ